MTAFGQALEFAVDYVSEKVGAEDLTPVLRIALPMLTEMIGIDAWDGEARLQAMSILDDALREVGV